MKRERGREKERGRKRQKKEGELVTKMNWRVTTLLEREREREILGLT